MKKKRMIKPDDAAMNINEAETILNVGPSSKQGIVWQLYQGYPTQEIGMTNNVWRMWGRKRVRVWGWQRVLAYLENDVKLLRKEKKPALHVGHI